MSGKLPIGVLASGNGTNLQAIIDNSQGGRINAVVRVVISDQKDAFALIRAKKAGIPAVIHERKDYASKEAFEDAIIATLNEHCVGLVCLAGFMRILSPHFIGQFAGRIMNIHPALLPSFPGLHAQKQALEHGVKISGCTVHFVDEGIDTGPIIIQAAVPVLDNDTEETLSARILKEEHRIYSEAIKFYAEGMLEIRGRSVVIKTKEKGDSL